MNPPAWNFITITTLLLISPGQPDTAKDQLQQQQKQHVPIITAYQSRNTPPYWESILREFVFKTISEPSTFGNYILFKQLLDAPFYSGPFPIVSNDDTSVVLSRGDVYYLPNNHWMLCQENCISCEICMDQKNPTVKWILRRIKSLSSHGSHRYDLQLTIIPQIDGSYHMKNLWPRSYVYVISPGELTAYSNDKSGYDAGSAFTNLDDSFSGQQEQEQQQQQRPSHFWRLVERNSMPDRRVSQEENNERTIQPTPENNSQGNEIKVTTTESIREEREPENNLRFKNIRRQRPRSKDTDKSDDTLTRDNSGGRGGDGIKQLLPKLILGTDQKGQKHLVHVVPADHAIAVTSRYPVALESSASPDTNDRSIKVSQSHTRTNYQRILRRIFDSLTSQKRSIEDFLEPSLNKVRVNQESSQTGKVNHQIEEHQEQETRNGLTELKQLGHVTRGYDENKIPYKRWPLTLNWTRERRKVKSTDNSDGNLKNNNYTMNAVLRTAI